MADKFEITAGNPSLHHRGGEGAETFPDLRIRRGRNSENGSPSGSLTEPERRKNTLSSFEQDETVLTRAESVGKELTGIQDRIGRFLIVEV